MIGRQPASGAPRRERDAVRAALLALDRPDGAFRVRDGRAHGVDLVAEATTDGRLLHTTSLALMEFDAERRVVRHARRIDVREFPFDGVIRDPERGWFPSLRDPGGELGRAAAMRRGLRDTVRRAGWAWRGALLLRRRGGVRVPWVEGNTPTPALFGAALCGLGVVFLIFGGASTNLLTPSERTVGTVVELAAPQAPDAAFATRREWYATVRYTVEGRAFTISVPTGATPPGSDTLPVEYDPADPSDAHLVGRPPDRFWPVFYTVFGVLAAAAGAVLSVTGREAARLRTWLRQEGREVWAAARVEGADASADEPRYVVRAEWRDEATGRTHTATSGALRADPGPRLAGRERVRVVYDSADPDRNMIDLEAVS